MRRHVVGMRRSSRGLFAGAASLLMVAFVAAPFSSAAKGDTGILAMDDGVAIGYELVRPDGAPPVGGLMMESPVFAPFASDALRSRNLEALRPLLAVRSSLPKLGHVRTPVY